MEKEKMTLDEVRLHVGEIAQKKRAIEKDYREMRDYEDPRSLTRKMAEKMKKGAEEYRQIEEWLWELKSYRAIGLTPYMIKDLIKSEQQSHKDAVHNAFLLDKVIDDLISKCESAKFADDDETVLSDIHQGVNSGLAMAIHFAKELKGERNDD